MAALESDPVLAFIPPSGSRIGSATASSAGGRQGWTWNGTIGCWNPYAVVIHFVDPAPLATTTAAVAVAASKAGWTAAPITPDQHTEGILGSWTKTYRHRYGADLTLSAVFVKNVAVSFYLTGAIGAAQHAC